MVALVMLVIGLSSAVSAVDDNTTDSVMSQTQADTTVEPVTTTTSSDTTLKNTKQIEKATKENVKTATKTVEVNDYNELATAINTAVADSENDEYVINLNNGTYQITSNVNLNNGTYTPKITINANQQTLTADSTNRILYFRTGCDITINDATISHRIINYNKMTLNNVVLNAQFSNNAVDSELEITNSTLNTTIGNSGKLTIDDKTTATENFKISASQGCTLSTNNQNITDTLKANNCYVGETRIENATITQISTSIQNLGNTVIVNSTLAAIYNYGNLTLINCSIVKGSLTYGSYNYGNMTIKDSTIDFKFENRNVGRITSINTTWKAQLTQQGFLEFINSTATVSLQNRGNMIFNNSTYYQINNPANANMTLTNTVLSNLKDNTNYINNNGVLTITDDVVFCDGFRIEGGGIINYSDMEVLKYYLRDYNGTYTIENTTFSGVMKKNWGNLTYINVTLNTRLDNSGNLILHNVTLNGEMLNYGNLTICDDVIIGENFKLNEQEGSTLIINDTSRIVTYITQYNGDYLLENYTINELRINIGKLTINNCTINNDFINRADGQLTILNSSIDGQINNQGLLILGDDVTLGSNFEITGNGQVICNDTTRMAPYLPTYTGNVTLENLTIKSAKTNNGNLTIINCTTNAITNNGNLTIENSTINGQLTNKGQLTINNSTINNRIQNTGTLTLGDNITFGSSFSIMGNGEIIADNMTKLFPYIAQFYGEATVELGNYNKAVQNYGKLTIENSTLTNQVRNNNANSEMTLKNTTTTSIIYNIGGRLELINATINGTISNSGTLIISDDTILGEKFSLAGNGPVIINDTQRIADYLNTYTGNIVLTNKTISSNKINNENLTLNNCTITAVITNNGRITIDENTVFSGNGKIMGTGEIITDNITRILPYIDAINGNYTITDTTLNKSYTFLGNITLNNCNITAKDNSNMGTLTLNDCTVDVGEENVFIDNLGTLNINGRTKIIGQIIDIGGQTIHNETPEPKTIVVTNRTAKYYFNSTDGGKLTSLVNPGDTLDIQGTICGIPDLNNLCVNKPVNIISTTKDAKISLNTTNGDLSGANPGNKFTINKEGSGTNVTGIYFFNTQLWLYNTDHVILDNISAVVDNASVGSGVGQTSIRANSSYITVKNSYFYTRNNGGSSTLVLAYANYCTIVNNTIVGGGGCGNLLYLTTYNVDVPRDAVYNSHNILANNTLEMMAGESSICWGIVLSGADNLVDGNILTFNGTGINFQWGSGSGSGEGSSLYNISGNVVSNNKLYGRSSISAGDIIYNNYVENGGINVQNAIAYNNTAGSMGIGGENSVATNNTITGTTGGISVSSNAKSAILADNMISGNVSIPSGAYNITLIGNNITGMITLDASNNNIINNSITTDEEYTVYSRRSCLNNVVTGNYLLSADKGGDDTVNLKDPSNTIENNLPITTKIEVIVAGETTVNTTTPVIIIVTRKEQLTTEDITLTVKGENETVTAKNGIIVYQYTPDTVGEQEITATFAGYGDYMTSTTTVMITVTPDKDAIIEELNNTLQQASKDCVLTIDTIPDIKFNDNLTIYGKLMDTKGTGISGEKVTVNVNGVDNTVTTDANGVWKLKVKTTTLGTNNVTATYSGTQYNPFTTTTTFQIAQTEAIITIDKIVTTQFRDNVTITGTFKNSNGKVIANSKVRVNVNGYSTYVTTDHDGVWSLTIKTNKTGVNNVTASFTGNANYAKYTANATFNVTKQDLIITTEVKYNKGNFTITGTFVDKNGNKLSNSKIRVNINGKAVYVKTDSNGTYTYSELVTAKTIKYNVYYGGSANYNSYTSSKTTLTVA